VKTRPASDPKPGFVDSLDGVVRSIGLGKFQTEWMHYYRDASHYSSDAETSKKHTVARILDDLQPRTVYDLGGNIGEYSRLATARGIDCICFDIDPLCVHHNYERARQENDRHMLPLMMDLSNPTPALGFNLTERASLVDRSAADLLLALAVLHHLRITANAPLELIAGFWRVLGTRCSLSTCLNLMSWRRFCFEIALILFSTTRKRHFARLSGSTFVWNGPFPLPTQAGRFTYSRRCDMFAATYIQRLLIFALLLALPVLRLLLHEDYGLIHLEAAAAVLLAVACAAALAALTFKPLVFHATVTGTAVFLSVNAIQTDLLPGTQIRWIIAGLTVGFAVGIYLGRQNFYKILCVFLTGSFLADVGKSVLTGSSSVRAGQVPQASTAKRNHVVHIILDEMLGLAAMPADCANCQTARSALEQTFRDGNFRIYPYAFSNYRGTRDSIPSILNNRLLTRADEYFRNENGRPVLRTNAYFDRYAGNKYAVRVYQSDYILYSDSKYASLAAETYNANSLKALHSINLHWTERLQQLLTIYVRADRFWWGMWNRAMPARFDLEPLRVGPLAAQDIWPAKILDDIRAASKDTLFFAHLLMPHYPYVYRRDGSVRMPEEWRGHSKLLFYSNQESAYRSRYEQYGEQVQFLNAQIASLLAGLRTSGHYDSTAIIIHGDHGSRLRLLEESERATQARLAVETPDCPAVSRYDYASEPDSLDLRNRFATLLAIKHAGAAAPELVSEKGSVLYFLGRDFLKNGSVAPDKGINSVYLFDERGRPKEIPMARLWAM
jgi:hypothetical protein